MRNLKKRDFAAWEKLCLGIKAALPIAQRFSEETGKSVAQEITLLARRALTEARGDRRLSEYRVYITFWRQTVKDGPYDKLEAMNMANIDGWLAADDGEVIRGWQSIFDAVASYAHDVHETVPQGLKPDELSKRAANSRSNMYRSVHKRMTVNRQYIVGGEHWLCKIGIAQA